MSLCRRRGESFDPLFHLLNGDLCYANLNPTSQPEVWRDFGNNNQRSASYRPWMPCPGNHEIEFDNGTEGLDSYLTRYMLPDNGVDGFRGRWYSFRVGSVLVVSLDADDVVYQDAAAFVAGPASLVPAASTGHAPIPAGQFLLRQGLQRWCADGVARADPGGSAPRRHDRLDRRPDAPVLPELVRDRKRSDLGIRQAWLPLFDKYQVDLVVCGHDHDYERSFPVRGSDSSVGVEAATGQVVDTQRPRPVTATDNGTFDTSQGTVHLILGGGGTNAPLDDYLLDPSDGITQAKVFTMPNRPVPSSTPGVYARAGADAREDAIWSAKHDPSTGYGIAVFDVEPGSAWEGETSITVRYFHATGADPTNPSTGVSGSPNPDYTLFETFTLVRPRSDRRFSRPVLRPRAASSTRG